VSTETDTSFFFAVFLKIVGATSTYLIILVQFSTAPSLKDIEGVICKMNKTGG
jgi:hypothetical protein